MNILVLQKEKKNPTDANECPWNELRVSAMSDLWIPNEDREEKFLVFVLLQWDASQPSTNFSTGTDDRSAASRSEAFVDFTILAGLFQAWLSPSIMNWPPLCMIWTRREGWSRLFFLF